jgi:thioredoxin-dependent peroxiredoxin
MRVGQEAPDFTLPDQDGNPVTLSALRGQPVVLYFYPKADTPGCTTQACGIRDHRAAYERAGAKVLGVSPDPVGAIKKFADRYTLDFELLADENHEVAELYGVWREKKMYGSMPGRAAAEGEARPVSRWGVTRSTFVIDPDGKVVKVFPQVSPKTHDEVVLEALGELASA